MSATIPPSPGPALLDASRVAELLGVTKVSLGRFVKSGQFPAPDLRVGARPRWRASTVDGWIAGQSRLPDTASAESGRTQNGRDVTFTPAEQTAR
jgi:predicted DNA-binding transcriptional regulator AlpA